MANIVKLSSLGTRVKKRVVEINVYNPETEKHETFGIEMRAFGVNDLIQLYAEHPLIFQKFFEGIDEESTHEGVLSHLINEGLETLFVAIALATDDPEGSKVLKDLNDIEITVKLLTNLIELSFPKDIKEFAEQAKKWLAIVKNLKTSDQQ